MYTNVLNPSEKIEFWIEHDLLFCKLNPIDCYLTEAIVRTYLLKIEIISRGKPMPLILDFRKFVGNFSPEAAKIFAGSSISKRCINAQAFIIDSLNGKLLVNSYIRIYGDELNVRIFDQKESAIEYCLENQKRLYVDNV